MQRDKRFVLLIYTFLLKIEQLIFKSFMHTFLVFQDNGLSTQINTSQITKKILLNILHFVIYFPNMQQISHTILISMF